MFTCVWTVMACPVLKDDVNHRNDAQAAQADVLLLEDGEPLFSERYGSESEARFAVESFRQDLVRTGWSI
jgi:hypothetical protein